MKKTVNLCIFCGHEEPNSDNLWVCSRCTSKFVGMNRDAIEKFAESHELNDVQKRFLSIR